MSAAAHQPVAVVPLSVALLAGLTSALGLTVTGLYRDNLLVASGWAGNDLVTLCVAGPVLAYLALGGAKPGARELLQLGLLDYMVYNYAFYLFGAAFNALFLAYVVLVTLAAVGLIQGLIHLDVADLARRFSTRAPARLVGGYLIVVAAGLLSVYVVQSLAFAASRRLPDVVTATGHPTSVVFALDLTLVVPPALLAGVWIWKRRPWGYALAVITSVKSTVYMLALSAATLGAWGAGALSSLSQLFLWGALGATSGGVSAALLGSMARAGPTS